LRFVFCVDGSAAFSGGDTRQKITRHRTEERLHQGIESGGSPAFAAFLGRMMSKNPLERPASCDEVRVELLKWSTGELARPMDVEGDANYRRAIWQLETEKNWPTSRPT